MTTTYGTIPTTTTATTTTQPPSSSPTTPNNLRFITRATHKIHSSLTTHRRPWPLLFSPSSLSLPTTTSTALLRLKTNLSFFRVNYAIISLLILFLSLLWHPISLIVFMLTMSAWLFLYFLRDEQLILFNRVVDDKIVLGVLAVLTVGFLLFTDVTVNIVVAVAVAVVVVGVHAVVRDVDDLPVEVFDEESSARGVYPRASGGFGERLPLKDTASSSFSAYN